MLLCHWSSQLFDLRALSSNDFPVLLLNRPILAGKLKDLHFYPRSITACRIFSKFAGFVEVTTESDREAQRDAEGKENRVECSAFLGGGVPRSSIP